LPSPDEKYGSFFGRSQRSNPYGRIWEEHRQGVGQINIAVSQMDKVTQNNAANAEETASASEELNAQAEALMEAVQQLTAVVEGNKSGNAFAEGHL